MAISHPGDYYKLRSELMLNLKRQIVTDMYTKIYDVLSKGTIGTDCATADHGGFRIGQAPLIPCYPSQKINDFSISVASLLGDELNKVIDILLPESFDKIAASKLTINGRSDTIV